VALSELDFNNFRWGVVGLGWSGCNWV